MTRSDLRKVDGRRRFRATFVRYGKATAYKGAPLTTILLRDVKLVETGEVVTDHLWLKVGKQLGAVGWLHDGDAIEFDARAKRYEKGYRGWRYKPDAPPATSDWKLAFPTKVSKVAGS